MNITIDNWQKVFGAKACSTDTMQLLGYELVEELFTDSSGFGADDEMALSVSQFERKIKELLQAHGKLTAKITGVGQFQVYVGLFKKTGKPSARRIASNVLLIEKDGKRIVRLYETDILTDNGNGTITVNNGGYATRTTHKRINEFSSLHATSKQFETYINGVKLSEQNTFDGWLTV
jgi:hypothetical protein